MKNMLVALLLAGAAAGSTTAVAAQGAADAVEVQFSEIAESVIRIRTIANLEYEETDPRTGAISTATRPYSVDGSGVIVGTLEIGGRTEYLILTNHHVADASNYVLEDGGYLRVNPTNTMAVPSVEETSYLVDDPGDESSEDDIRLIELVRLVRGDMTLMRTDGADRKLPFFGGAIGYRPDEIGAGAPIITSGFPLGGKKLVAEGTIAETDHLHELGLPHHDFIVDVPVAPGQSGGPIFLVEGDPAVGEAVSFRLIGLVHAKDRERNYAVPYALWTEALDEFPGVLVQRLRR
ncbi:MAG: serine protease [Gemmatimonadota bacterium]